MGTVERVVLLDLAAETRLPQKTVIAVLHGLPGIPDELQATVNKAALKIGYHSRILPSLDVAIIVSNPELLDFSAQLSRLIKDFRIMTPISLTFGVQEIEKRAVAALKKVDAMVLLGSNLSPSDCDKIVGQGISLMVVEPYKAHPSNISLSYSLVNTDYQQAGSLAMHELLSKGHRRIAYLERTAEINPELMRLKGMENAIAQTNSGNVDFVTIPSPVLKTDPYQEGYTQASSMLDSMRFRPDAVIAWSDEVAIGAMSALRDNGLSIPEDISVIGFGNYEVRRYAIPRVTSVGVTWSDMARPATESLLRMLIASPDTTFKPVILKPHIFSGESVKQR